MELITKIKQAEADAQQMIEQAKADAGRGAEETRRKRAARLAEAEQARRKAVETAVERAQEQGRTEAAALKAESDKQCEQLRRQTESKIDAAVQRVVGYLKG
jgi:V/A-type H+/Na+-transporting ATPase subunit G/H